MIISGVGPATVIGVLLGSLVGNHWPARRVLGPDGPSAVLIVGRFIPAEPLAEAAPSVRSEFAALRTGRLRLVPAASVLPLGGVMGRLLLRSPSAHRPVPACPPARCP
ncbi:hypothetical protein ACWEQP_00370 [Streptomyces sp. NPDC004044]